MGSPDHKPFAITLFIIDILTGILFFGLFVVAVLPSIGLNLLPDSWFTNIKTQLPLLTLGALGYIACHLIVERLRVSHSFSKRLDSIQESHSNMEVRLSESIPAVRISDKREQSYSHLRYQLAKLPPRTQLMVTHFEKNRAASYSEGERPAEKDFMKFWQELILSDIIDVKQIVHVASRFDLEEVRDRLKQFKECNNFEMSLMAGPFVQPYQDVVIAAGHWVDVVLPDDPNHPCKEKISVFLNSSEIANAFTSAFMANWGSQECSVIRGGGQVNTQFLTDLESVLPDKLNEGLITSFRTIPCEIAALGDLAKPLGSCVSLIHDIVRRSRVSDYSRHLIKQINELKLCLAKDRDTPFSINGASAFKALMEILRAAKRSVIAVSVDQTVSSFWHTEFGKDFLDVNRVVAGNDVTIQRVFVIGSQDGKRSAPAIREHEKFAECRVVAQDQTSKANDFLIVDSEVVYIVIAEQEGVITECNICINQTTINEKSQEFNQLWNIGKKPAKFFRGRIKNRKVYKDR